MSAKERSQKIQHTKTRTTCLPSCFSAVTGFDSDDSDPSPAVPSTSTSRHQSEVPSTSSWSSWFEKKKKKKKKNNSGGALMSQLLEDDDHNDVIKYSAGSKRSFRKSHTKTRTGKIKSQVKPKDQHQRLDNDATTTTKQRTQNQILPTISSMYNTRIHPAPSPSPSSNPVQKTGARKTRSLSPEPSQPTRLTQNSDQDQRRDPVVGLLILVPTLIVMLLFGRACAVVCLCACLGLLPLFLQTKTGSTVAGSDGETKSTYIEVDMDSEEYKKRVVLEGLLERNGRRLSASPAAGMR